MQPVSLPLKSLEAVEAWHEGSDNCAVASVSLRTRPPWHKPRLLACHDFKGGYQDDRFIQGSGNADAYRFFSWHLIDEFVYFSHYFVTIPPPGWINAAHLHGVPVYGTVITEWDDGKARCTTFLATRESYTRLVEKLVDIAKYYRFDGWLINIENVIEEHLVENLVGFVRLLTDKMHKAVAHSRVIWYDSVIESGQLKWQNELNQLNCQYFNACDGIFVNYTWKDANLQNSAAFGTELGRLYDVYIGIDVFGRGCPGGGGFNSKQALEAICQHNLSAAIFAFGWVYQKLGKKNFLMNELRFWSMLYPWCNTKPYCHLPVSLHFCQGQGNMLKSSGQVVSERPWSNMSLQSLQPSLPCLQVKEGEYTAHAGDVQLTWCDTEAYHGGCCLQLSGRATCNSSYVRLLELACGSEKDVLVGCVLQRQVQQAQITLDLKLHTGDVAHYVHMLLMGDADVDTALPLADEEVSRLLHTVEDNLDPETWMLKLFRVNIPSTGTMWELGVQFRAEPPVSFNVYLGQVFIIPDKVFETPLVTGLTFEADSTESSTGIRGVLTWSCPDNTVHHYKVYARGEEQDPWTYIGHTHTTCYKVNVQQNVNDKDIGSHSDTAENTGAEVDQETDNVTKINMDAVSQPDDMPQTNTEALIPADIVPQTNRDVLKKAENVPQTNTDDLNQASNSPQTNTDDLNQTDNVPITNKNAVSQPDNMPQTNTEAVIPADNVPQTNIDALNQADNVPQTNTDEVSQADATINETDNQKLSPAELTLRELAKANRVYFTVQPFTVSGFPVQLELCPHVPAHKP